MQIPGFCDIENMLEECLEEEKMFVTRNDSLTKLL